MLLSEFVKNLQFELEHYGDGTIYMLDDCGGRWNPYVDRNETLINHGTYYWEKDEYVGREYKTEYELFAGM